MAPLRMPPLLGYLLNREGHESRDQEVARELNVRRQTSLSWPSGLSMQWLGTSGFRLSYQGYDLLIDPYLTRLSLSEFLRNRVVGPHSERINKYIDNADAVLIGHTHFDHALDAPWIARRYGCKVYGSDSTRRLMALYGLEEQSVLVEHYKPIELGPFRVTFVPSVHAKLKLGLAVPYSGDVCCEHLDELTPGAYRCGQVYALHIEVAGFRFYHQGSADLLDDAVRHKGVDVFLAGIAGRGFTKDYVARILRKLEPKLIIPTHYDNFFLQLDSEMRMSTNINFAGFVDEVEAVSREFDVATVEPLEVLEA